MNLSVSSELRGCFYLRLKWSEIEWDGDEEPAESHCLGSNQGSATYCELYDLKQVSAQCLSFLVFQMGVI